MAETKTSSWLKPSLDWLLIFVPVAIALRFIPGLNYPKVKSKKAKIKPLDYL